MKEKIFAFWSINEALNLDKAVEDINLFLDSGLDGVVFQPRNYPGPPAYLTPAYYDLVSQLIIYCKEQKLEFWIYDENGWPSGTADGKVMAVDSSLKKEWLELKGFSTAYSYQKFQEEGEFAYHYEAQPSAICKKATELFINIVYEGYRKGLTKEAFDYITGFFSDETALPLNKTVASIPWSEELATVYRQKTKRLLSEDLPALFFDDFAAQKRTEEIRYTFWELCSYLLAQNYYQPLSAWCQKHNKRFTAHLRGEENIALSIPFSGSAFQVLKFVDLPMVDALERKRTNQFYPRIASSLSCQFHDGNTFCEAMGGSGWGVAPDDIVQYYEWLSDCNINITCLHQSHLQLKAQALKDWPPSIPKHLSWQPLFSEVLEDVHQVYHAKESNRPVLAVVPVRRVMANYHAWELSQTNRHKGDVQPETSATAVSLDTNTWVAEIAAQFPNLHLIDEHTFESEAVLQKDSIQVGHQTYERVLIHEACLFLNSELESSVQRFSFELETVVGTKETAISINKNLIRNQSTWQLQQTNENLLPFGENYFQAGVMKKTIQIKDWNNVSLLTTDLIDGLCVNGIQLSTMSFAKGEHFIYALPSSCLKKGSNLFEITALAVEPQPMCWLKGDFSVEVIQKKTGSNCLIAMQTSLDRAHPVANFEQLSEQGYPFIGSALLLTKEFYLDQSVKEGKITFSYFEAAGARIVIDGQLMMSYWSGRELQAVNNLSAGEHTVEVTLYPSTFNAYGPYRYVGGDNKVISPLQYLNEKNLMDAPFLPEKIQHDYLNYKNTGLGELIIHK